MDLLAKKRMLLVLIVGCAAFPSGVGADLYSIGRIEYFAVKDNARDQPSPPDPLWVERGFAPPAVVEAFLDDPNETTALKYLAWQKERLKKIAEAQRILERLPE